MQTSQLAYIFCRDKAKPDYERKEKEGRLFFPFGLSGSIRLRNIPSPDSLVKPAIDRIEDMLDDAGATFVDCEGSEVQFKAGLFRQVWNWNILVPFGSGRIRIETHASSLLLKYRLSTIEMLVAVIAMLGLVWLIAPKLPFSDLVFIWLWLFGMNYLIAAVRFPLWLQRGLGPIRKR